MVGIFPPGLGAAGQAIGQTAPMPLPLPVPGPATGPMGGSGTGTGADGDLRGLSRRRSRERPCKCPPEKGNMEPVNHSMSDLSAEYQHYVTNFPIGIEWLFAETDFDGFLKARCLLQETKARYDQFFNPKNGKPKFFFLIGKSEKTPSNPKKVPGWKKMLEQATRQSDIVRENPPSEMRWYFMQPLLYGFATNEFGKRGLAIETEYKPMPGKEAE